MRNMSFITVLIAVVIFSGCSNAPKLDPQKHPAIMVYPSIDIRETKEPPLEKIESKKVLLKNRFTFAEEILYNRNLYVSRYLKNPQENTVTYHDLIEPDSEKLKTIPSEGSRYVLIIVINKFTFQSDIITLSDIGLEGYLIDKKEGVVVWKNSTEKEFNQLNIPIIIPYTAGPVLGSVSLMPKSKYYGIYAASTSLLKDFPVLKYDQTRYLP